MDKLKSDEEIISHFLWIFNFRVHYFSNFFQNSLYCEEILSNNPFIAINTLYIQNETHFWGEALKNSRIVDLISISNPTSDKSFSITSKWFHESFKKNSYYKFVYSEHQAAFIKLEHKIRINNLIKESNDCKDSKDWKENVNVVNEAKENQENDKIDKVGKIIKIDKIKEIQSFIDKLDKKSIGKTTTKDEIMHMSHILSSMNYHDDNKVDTDCTNSESSPKQTNK